MNQETGEEDIFDRVLAEIDRIEVEPNRHLSVQIANDTRAMIRAAFESGKDASVTIKLVAKRKGEMIQLTGSSTAKLPRMPVGTVNLYADEDGDLYDHNPHHAASSLPGVDVATPKKQRTKAPVETPINAEGRK